MKKFSYIFLIFILSHCICSCVSEFHPKGIDGMSNLMVVEGFITEGESTFKFSRSLDISEEKHYAAEANISDLYIECSDGNQLRSYTSLREGAYQIQTGKLDPEKQYRLYFRLYNGEEYASEFLSPLITPEIDTITYVKTGEGEPVQICVNTEEEKNQSRYFLWSYVEDWEVWARYLATHSFDDEYNIYELVSPENTFYCWGNEASSNLFLGSTTSFNENKLVNYKIFELSPYSDKLSVLYHVRLYQNLIRKEAYDYFYNLQKNIDQNSGLFTSMPTEIKGNIQNLTHPETPVIGYVEVSTTVTSARYIDYSEGLYEFGREYYEYSKNCEKTTDDWDEAMGLGYYPFYLGDDGFIFKPRRCVDCRAKYRASKNKPDFWPGDRQ